jgi:ethanolamine utilization protein EutN
MFVGIVRGEIYSTINHPFYDGKKLMVVERVREDGAATGDYIIAVDRSVDSGVGDRVLVLDEGNSARQIMGSSDAPIRSIIVGIVDSVTPT